MTCCIGVLQQPDGAGCVNSQHRRGFLVARSETSSSLRPRSSRTTGGQSLGQVPLTTQTFWSSAVSDDVFCLLIACARSPSALFQLLSSPHVCLAKNFDNHESAAIDAHLLVLLKLKLLLHLLLRLLRWLLGCLLGCLRPDGPAVRGVFDEGPDPTDRHRAAHAVLDGESISMATVCTAE